MISRVQKKVRIKQKDKADYKIEWNQERKVEEYKQHLANDVDKRKSVADKVSGVDGAAARNHPMNSFTSF